MSTPNFVAYRPLIINQFNRLGIEPRFGSEAISPSTRKAINGVFKDFLEILAISSPALDRNTLRNGLIPIFRESGYSQRRNREV